MSNKLILDLTVRLTEALDQNYDVVNMDTVLAVISALEGATITKEQLETTRLAKHINQLRRRTKSNILAIRAKNLLKKWREMFGITSQAQSEGAVTTGTSSSSTALQATLSAPKPALLCISQPASPVGGQFDNSLSSIGVDFSRTISTKNTTGNTASTNKKSIKQTTTTAAGVDFSIMGSRSNGALGKSANRQNNATNNSLPATIINAATNKVHHPTSFKNLISAISSNNADNISTQKTPNLSPTVLPAIAINEDDRYNQLQPSVSSSVIVGGTSGLSGTINAGISSSPRTHKSMKRKEQNSNIIMSFLDNSSSAVTFENLSQKLTPTDRLPAPPHHSSILRNQSLPSTTIDLADSDSSSNFTDVIEVGVTTATPPKSLVGETNDAMISFGKRSKSNGNKRIRRDKFRPNERIDADVNESELFQPPADESSFPISGTQDYLSLSNSSMSIFPAGSGIGGEEYDGDAGSGVGGCDGDGGGIVGGGDDCVVVGINYGPYQNKTNKNNDDDNRTADIPTGRDIKISNYLSFAGKFKHNSVGGIDVVTGTVKRKDRPENISAISSSGLGSTSSSTITTTTANEKSAFLPFSRNSNESSSNSQISLLDLVHVINQDSQSMITVDDMREKHYDKQSSNEKTSTSPEIKFPKDVFFSNTPKQQQNLYKDQYNAKSVLATNQRLQTYSTTTIGNTSTTSTSSTSVISSMLPAVKVQQTANAPVAATEQKVLKKRGRKKGSKGIDSVLAQTVGLNAHFLMSPTLCSTKKVKTTRELLIDIQSRKMGSTTSSPTLMSWFGTSRPASSCSEPSSHSPKTFDVNSTNATTIATIRSSPEKNTSNNSVGADEIYASDSDTNTSDPSNETMKRSTAATCDSYNSNLTTATAGSSIEKQINELLAQLPKVDTSKIDWETYEYVPCTCTLREILPELPDNEDAECKPSNNLNIIQNVVVIKNQINDDDEPVISVSLPLAASPQKPLPSITLKSTSPCHISHNHSQSAPVSTVTSPIGPPRTKQNHITEKPTKSIFDLDFDDDNDPLPMFVEEAASISKQIVTSLYDEKLIPSSTQPVEHVQGNLEQKETIQKLDQTRSDINLQSETKLPHQLKQQSVIALPHQLQIQQETTDLMMPLHSNFPTYEVIEDSQCKAKQRYETQTNQVTEFHVNAIHNCYIPNVNGNWDHSIPQKINVEDEQNIIGLQNDSFYANVVPKYGCLVKERIPKDLSFMKFTKNLKPKLKRKKSDKSSPLPFLGVANIHRQQHFHLHHYHKKLKKKQTIKVKNIRKTKKQKQKSHNQSKSTSNNNLEEIKQENVSLDDVKSSNDVDTKETFETALEKVGDFEITSNPTPVANNQSECNELASVASEKPKSLLNSQQLDNPNQGSSSKTDLIVPIVVDKTTQSNTTDTSDASMIFSIENDENKSSLLLNGHVSHLMNNNNIIKSVDRSCNNKLVVNNHNNSSEVHRTEVNENLDINKQTVASRRSSSCSNSSLKQNQISINMKLRQHRLEHVKLKSRKRKSLSTLTDVFEFGPDTQHEANINEQEAQLKAPSLIKRIKLVNGTYTEARRLTNSMTDSSCVDEDNDSDCFHVHSENDIITEEDEDDDGDQTDQDDNIEDFLEEYDEDDGDDQNDEISRDFHEVVTRDMMSSTTGNNHIVLTIKKTPSKTNSPSSSSRSPAPPLVANTIAMALTSPTPKISSVESSDKFVSKNTAKIDSLGNNEQLVNLRNETTRVQAVDLVTKTDFFLPQAANVSVYNFQLKKCGDNNGDDESIEDDMPLPFINEEHDEQNENDTQLSTIQQQSQGHNVDVGQEQAAVHVDLDTDDVIPLELQTSSQNEIENEHTQSGAKCDNNKQQKILVTNRELSNSIQLTGKHIRRIKLRKSLREGIEQAKKLHRQLFFPCELRTSGGLKILEIQSCTSDCTDASSDNETSSDGSDGDHTELTTSSSSGNGNLKTRMIKKRRRIKKLLLSSKERCNGGGGNPPSSSSSSSSSSSPSSSAAFDSSSASAFTSWTTTDEDDDGILAYKSKKKKIDLKNNNTKAENKELQEREDKVVKEEVEEEEGEREEEEEEEEIPELPAGNNFLLRSFNHIYVSTRERQRQEQLKKAPEYQHHREVFNSSIGGYITLSGDDSKNDVSANETQYYDVNPRYYNMSNNKLAKEFDELQFPSKQQSLSTKIDDDDKQKLEQPLSDQLGITTEEEDGEQEKLTAKAHNNVNTDENVKFQKNNNLQFDDVDDTAAIKCEKTNEEEEDDFVVQEEYRTGIRRVDEDVVDEDGNNCARTQQFKEWHEVLQLRSYNDELLTVLPYVVIE